MLSSRQAKRITRDDVMLDAAARLFTEILDVVGNRVKYGDKIVADFVECKAKDFERWVVQRLAELADPKEDSE